jgi:hypothetical protein
MIISQQVTPIAFIYEINASERDALGSHFGDEFLLTEDDHLRWLSDGDQWVEQEPGSCTPVRVGHWITQCLKSVSAIPSVGEGANYEVCRIPTDLTRVCARAILGDLGDGNYVVASPVNLDSTLGKRPIVKVVEENSVKNVRVGS